MVNIDTVHSTLKAVMARSVRPSALVAYGGLALAISCLALCATTSHAGAVATVGSPPFAGPTGLPDGRVYEQASPGSKHGNFFDAARHERFGLASSNGDAVVYPTNGAVGEEASWGLTSEFVSRRTPGHGWQTASTTPNPTSEVAFADGPDEMIPSADFTRFAFFSIAPFVSEDPGGLNRPSGVNIFLSYGPFVKPAWLGKPRLEEPIPNLGKVGSSLYSISGASASLNTVYFTYQGTLVPEDASREQYVAIKSGPEKAPAERNDNPEGFYEWHEGQLVLAGALPDGSFNPFGSVAAGLAGAPSFYRRGRQQADTIDNQISEDGTRAFFVSPDPEASSVTDAAYCSAEPPCTSEPPELYLREPGPAGDKVSVLVSASHLPGHEGEAAPTGVRSMPSPIVERSSQGTDIYASPDGSHALFASSDQLTSVAPANAELKMYDYNAASGELTYLPGVTPPLVQVSRDGSDVLFEDQTSTPYQLKLWHDGPGGGTVTPIADLPQGVRAVNVDQAHIGNDDAVAMFRTNSAIPGGFNNAGGYEQVYRYETASQSLSCVSCPPAGIAPTGDARTSYNNDEGEVTSNGSNADPATTIETRAMSDDGRRMFFDTPSALVPQDTNGARDVYEWENGTVYLISSGNNPEESLYLDNDSAGENVFFATSADLVAGDDGGDYDVYDARIPRPGDNPQPLVPCKGSVCQGPPSVPQLLGEPASQTFEGTGNLSVATHTNVTPKSLTRAQKLKRALTACERRKDLGKRRKCIRRAHTKYGAKVATARSGRNLHSNGRIK